MKEKFESLTSIIREACKSIFEITELDNIQLKYDAEDDTLVIDLGTYQFEKDRIQLSMEACGILGIEPEIVKKKSILTWGDTRDMENQLSAREDIDDKTTIKIFTTQNTGETCQVIGYEEKLVKTPIWECP